jgi:hypothetical protein
LPSPHCKGASEDWDQESEIVFLADGSAVLGRFLASRECASATSMRFDPEFLPAKKKFFPRRPNAALAAVSAGGSALVGHGSGRKRLDWPFAEKDRKLPFPGKKGARIPIPSLFSRRLALVTKARTKLAPDVAKERVPCSKAIAWHLRDVRRMTTT